MPALKSTFFINLFGGYASPRKHAVFSRLALNSYKFDYMMQKKNTFKLMKVFFNV